MLTKQLFQFPNEGENFTISVREMPSREDQEDLKAIVDKRYKKAQRAFCQSLIASCEEKVLLKNKSSLN